MKLINGKPVIRCSSLDQLLSCPGSRTLVELMGIFVEDDRASWEGQYCHYQAALRFIEKHGAMPPEGGLIGPKIAGYVPDSFAEWIVDYYHRAVMEETPADWAMEVEAEMIYEFPKFWLSGHVDVNAVAPDASALNFDDLKSGVNIVDAAECNEQVFGYAGLFKLAYGDRLKRIRGRIIQPRVKEGEGKRITAVIIDEKGTWNDEGQLVSEATINDIVPTLERRISEALEKIMTLHAGIKQCRWCPAWKKCPELEQQRDSIKMELTKEALARIKDEPDDHALARWVIAKKILGNKLDKAGDLMKERLAVLPENTLEAEGVKFALTPWTGARTFTDEAKPTVWEEIVGTLDEARAYACMDISPSAMEEQFAKQLNLPQESKKSDSGEKQVLNRFGGLWTRKTGKQLTIVG